MNRLKSEALTGNTVIAFTYDAMGQQLTMTDASGTTSNTYDVLGRVTSEVNGRGNQLSYEYDKTGRRTALIDPENGRTLYAYADNGWLTSLTDPQSGVTSYTYDALGRELTKTLPNGVVSSHVYNAVGYETSLEERDVQSTLLSSYASTYNKVGMKLTTTEKDGAVITYVYYANYALASETRTGSSPYTIVYFYDAAGNRLRTEVDGVETTTFTDAANQITSKVGPNGTTNFAYDDDGNLSSETAPDGSGKSYTFDGRDQLVAVEVKSAGGALSHRSEFAYDGMGRLMKSSEFTRSGTAWLKQSETGRVFDGLDTVQERGDNNALLAQLTRDGNIGGVLSRKTWANVSFFGYDGNGNVVTLSDAQGNSVGRYRYDGFGNALEVTGSAAVENEHRFSTKELHAPSGLYYYGFRFYSPALGSWINRDPIREMGGLNLYQMVGNNTVNWVDLYGLLPDLIKTGKTSAKVDKSKYHIPADIVLYDNHIRIDGKGAPKVVHALSLIFSTPIGARMLRAIKSKNLQIMIYANSYRFGENVFGDDIYFGGTFFEVAGIPNCSRAAAIIINTSGELVGSFTGVKSPFPFDVILAHELGHAVFQYEDWEGVSPGDNVNIVENTYRSERRAQIAKGMLGILKKLKIPHSTYLRITRGSYAPRLKYTDRTAIQR